MNNGRISILSHVYEGSRVTALPGKYKFLYFHHDRLALDLHLSELVIAVERQTLDRQIPVVR